MSLIKPLYSPASVSPLLRQGVGSPGLSQAVVLLLQVWPSDQQLGRPEVVGNAASQAQPTPAAPEPPFNKPPRELPHTHFSGMSPPWCDVSSKRLSPLSKLEAFGHFSF